MKTKNVLEADGIMMSFGANRILSGVYIRSEQGMITGLLGRNGSGKSTLLKMIFGSLHSEDKSVRINGVFTEAGYLGSTITFLPQGNLIPSDMKIIEAIRLFDIEVSVIDNAFPESRMFLDKKPDEFSGGELRFMELLLILYSRSKFCLLDEPFTGLAPAMIERAITILNEVKESKGILITDHLYRYVTKCADKLYCLVNGRIVSIQHLDQLATYGYLAE